eukprot:COSAG05_NODE_5342_length_1202_cov_5.725953_2_plen_100_part_00
MSLAAFTTRFSSKDDAVIIEGIDGTSKNTPCLTARYADGRPWLSTSTKDQDTSVARVVFDVATTPLPVGEYLVRLDSKSQEDEVAMTYFTVIEPYGEPA